MHIITIMDYKKGKPTILCKAWLAFAIKYNPRAKITIFHTGKGWPLASFVQYNPRIRIQPFSIPKSVRQITEGFTHHPAQELQLGLWHEIEKRKIYKFIYVDADALILDSLDDWWRIISQKPLIGIPERRLDDDWMLMNAGVFSYSSRHGFITLAKLIEQYKQDGKRIILQAGQQGILNSYLRRMHYDFMHKHIGHEYNTLAKYSQIRIVNGSIVARIGHYPFIKTLKHAITGRKEWSAYWTGWNAGGKAKILHAFGGKGYKFWELPECRDLWQYCRQIAQRDHL